MNVDLYTVMEKDCIKFVASAQRIMLSQYAKISRSAYFICASKRIQAISMADDHHSQAEIVQELG